MPCQKGHSCGFSGYLPRGVVQYPQTMFAEPAAKPPLPLHSNATALYNSFRYAALVQCGKENTGTGKNPDAAGGFAKQSTELRCFLSLFMVKYPQTVFAEPTAKPPPPLHCNATALYNSFRYAALVQCGKENTGTGKKSGRRRRLCKAKH